jgi:hypothetical protein
MDFDNIPTIEKKHDEPKQVGDRLDSIDEIMKYLGPDQKWVQFGVAAGQSAKYILSLMPESNTLYLLDSFEGLPENWGKNPNQKKGAFKLKEDQIPVFDDPRAIVLKGWFKDTVKDLVKIDGPFSFLHIDCDIYSSTVDALFGVGNYISDPCYILFDEFYNYPDFYEHEYIAFLEFIHTFDYKYKPLFKTQGSQVAFEVWG